MGKNSMACALKGFLVQRTCILPQYGQNHVVVVVLAAAALLIFTFLSAAIRTTMVVMFIAEVCSKLQAKTVNPAWSALNAQSP